MAPALVHEDVGIVVSEEAKKAEEERKAQRSAPRVSASSSPRTRRRLRRKGRPDRAPRSRRRPSRNSGRRTGSTSGVAGHGRSRRRWRRRPDARHQTRQRGRSTEHLGVLDRCAGCPAASGPSSSRLGSRTGRLRDWSQSQTCNRRLSSTGRYWARRGADASGKGCAGG